MSRKRQFQGPSIILPVSNIATLQNTSQISESAANSTSCEYNSCNINNNNNNNNNNNVSNISDYFFNFCQEAISDSSESLTCPSTNSVFYNYEQGLLDHTQSIETIRNNLVSALSESKKELGIQRIDLMGVAEILCDDGKISLKFSFLSLSLSLSLFLHFFLFIYIFIFLFLFSVYKLFSLTYICTLFDISSVVTILKKIQI